MVAVAVAANRLLPTAEATVCDIHIVRILSLQ